MLGSGDRLLAADFLRRSAEEKVESVATAEPMTDASNVPPLARWYMDIRSETAMALLTADSKAIRTMVDSLPRRLSGKPAHSTSFLNTKKGA